MSPAGDTNSAPGRARLGFTRPGLFSCLVTAWVARLGPVTARPAIPVAGLLLALGSIGPAVAQPSPTTPPAAADDASLQLPGLRVDRASRSVLLDARVVGQDADWLELIACAPKSREHEALLVIDARPSHLHLALTTLGFEAGAPRTARRVGPGQWQADPARGPEVVITVIAPGIYGPVESPIQTWYAASTDPHDTPADRFLFTGSQTRTHDGQTFYLADLSGSAISLVHFGDDTIARRTALTQNTDGQTLKPTDRVPPNGTPVTLRLRPAAPAPSPDRDPDGNSPSDATPTDTPDPSGG
ncbi:MAG: YdjY domain-containing protein [Planctomycetota bacterium]